jgi:hypothetical protein
MIFDCVTRRRNMNAGWIRQVDKREAHLNPEGQTPPVWRRFHRPKEI